MVAFAFNAIEHLRGVMRPREAAPAPRAAFKDEKEAHAFVKRFLDARGWAYAEQYDTGSGRIDFCLMADNKPWLGIEVKREIDELTSASQLADYFEQALGYSIDLDVPVVLAPVIFPLRSFDAIHTGGSSLRAIPAMTIFCGRANVGVFAFDSADIERRACLALRGQVFYRFCRYRGLDEFIKPEETLRMVRSRNSSKVRE